MVVVNRAGGTRSYVLQEDREKPEAEQTIFHLRLMKARAKMKIMDSIVGFEDGEASIGDAGSALYDACRYGIDRWDNLKDENGEDVLIRTRRIGNDKTVTDESLDLIGSHIAELGTQVMIFNRLTGTEEDAEGNAEGDLPNS